MFAGCGLMEILQQWRNGVSITGHRILKRIFNERCENHAIQACTLISLQRENDQVIACDLQNDGVFLTHFFPHFLLKIQNLAMCMKGLGEVYYDNSAEI